MAFALDLNNRPSDYALTPEQMSPFGNLLQNALKNFSAGINAGYLPAEKQQNLQQQIAQTLIDQAKAKYALPQEAANVNLTQQQGNQAGAQAGYLGQEAIGQGITNQTLNEANLAKIMQDKAMANFYNMGGGRGGVDVASNNQFHQAIAAANPKLASDPNKLMEAATVLRNGGTTLSDGTPINESGDTKYWGNVTSKQQTTSGLITQGVQANQAAKELPIAQQFVRAGLAPYGNTILNKSPQQIVDTFGSDDASQDRLGRLIAAKQLNYDIAQMQAKIANGRPGVRTTEELMKLSGQNIDDRYPMLSDRARRTAQDTIDAAMNQVLAARNQVGYGAGQLSMGNQSSNVVNAQGGYANPGQQAPSSLVGFKNKAEFQTWYAKQPENVKQNIRQQLAGRGQ